MFFSSVVATDTMLRFRGIKDDGTTMLPRIKLKEEKMVLDVVTLSQPLLELYVVGLKSQYV